MTTRDQLINKRLGRVIAKKRRVAGFTQEEVAEELGIGNEALSRIERGVNGPSVDKLYVMANMFQCGIESFLIEGSRRSTDQAEYMDQLLKKLQPTDRQLVVAIVEKLCKRLDKGARVRNLEHDADEFPI